MDHFSEYKAIQNEINAALETYFTADCPQKELLDAMRYSLLAGGKRIRPLLLVKFCEISGGDRAAALPAACGIEMLHTYSLIHDDLPCMDNDDMRRGKPTCHKMFGETNAVLAGDALQSAAYCAVLSAPAAPERTAAMAKTLAFAAAEQGMCGGQYLDTSKEGLPVTEAELYEIHRLKTGALLRAACGFPDPRRCARHDLHGGRAGQDHRFRRCREKDNVRFASRRRGMRPARTSPYGEGKSRRCRTFCGYGISLLARRPSGGPQEVNIFRIKCEYFLSKHPLLL